MRRYRADVLTGPVAFYIEKTDHIEKILRDWENTPPRGRSPAALARNTKWRAGVISDRQNRLRLARQYDAETENVLDVSGMNAAKKRLSRADDVVWVTRELLSRELAWTHSGLSLKAQVMCDELGENGSRPSADAFAGTPLGRLYRLVHQMVDA